MIKLNDHYFIAWLKAVKGYSFTISNGSIYVDMTSSQYSDALIEYQERYKPILKEIRKTVKVLAALTSKPN